MKNNKFISGILLNAFLLFFYMFSVKLHAQTSVSVFSYPGLNGSGGCGTENETLVGIISAIPGFTVDNTITSFSDPTILANKLKAKLLDQIKGEKFLISKFEILIEKMHKFSFKLLIFFMTTL